MEEEEARAQRKLMAVEEEVRLAPKAPVLAMVVGREPPDRQ